MEPEFRGFPKMARLSRRAVITEKIDGTNSQLLITEDGDIFPGSRNRWLTTGFDNYGFARWVEGNKGELLKLGPGRHFGEWWGSGIQRGYGLKKGDKRFSLFNTIRWVEYGVEPEEIPSDNPKEEPKLQQVLPEIVSLVPVINESVFDTNAVDWAIRSLVKYGSIASPGFMNPEGIVVFHVAANVGFKKLIENDHLPKSLV